MALARALDGVISGEHGIGITKLDYLTEAEIGPSRLQEAGRPGRPLQPRQADARRPTWATPTRHQLQPAGHRVADHGAVRDRQDFRHDIKDCLRCGKCKPVCSTHVPRANLLYSPRNKILGTSLLVEAFLYEEQTRRGVSLAHFDEFNDVADHCTICHRCEKPCPVDIDFGDVSVAMRNFLRKQGKKSFSPGQGGGDGLPHHQGPGDDQADAQGHDRVGLQGAAPRHRLAKALGLIRAQHARRRHARRADIKDAGHPLHQQADAGRAAQAHLARAARHRGRQGRAGDPRSAKTSSEDSDAVFYFPGCGSERLFSQVGLATQAMLYELGAPPCCRPATCAAATRRPPPARRTKGRRSPPTTACSSTASPTR
jgi:ferredoxin